VNRNEFLEKQARKQILVSDGIRVCSGFFYRCNACKQPIADQGLRFTCWECDEALGLQCYDVCAPCITRHQHRLRACTFASYLIKEAACASERLEIIFDMYEERKCLGWRDSLAAPYRWISYGEVGEQMKTVSTYLQRNLATLLTPQTRFVGLCGKNSLQWYVADYAMVHAGLVACPIHFTFADSAVAHILNQTGLATVFIDVEEKAKYLRCASQCPTLKNIIIMNDADASWSSGIHFCFSSIINLLFIFYLSFAFILVIFLTARSRRRRARHSVAPRDAKRWTVAACSHSKNGRHGVNRYDMA
jgi:hypothetical protein